MQFDSISAFFNMGGYGFYVWLSYGVSLLMIGLLIFMSCQSHKKVKHKIAQRFNREKKLREAAKRQAEQASIDLSEENNESTS